MRINKRITLSALLIVSSLLSLSLIVSILSCNNSRNIFLDLRDENILIVGKVDGKIQDCLIEQFGEDKYPFFHSRVTPWGSAFQDCKVSNLSLRESVIISDEFYDLFQYNYSSRNRAEVNLVKSTLNADACRWIARVEGRHSYADISCFVYKCDDKCSVLLVIQEYAK